MAEPASRIVDPIWDLMNKYHIIEFEQKIQNKILKALFGDSAPMDAATSTAAQALPPAFTPQPPAATAAIVEEPARTISITGFYKVTGPTELTFYATTTWPGFTVGTGWSIVGVRGVVGNLRVSAPAVAEAGATPTTSLTTEPYNWKFTIQSDTNQYIEGTTHVMGAYLYPPGQEQYPSQERSGPVYGYYEVYRSIPTFYFTAPPPEGTTVGWYIVGLPTLGASKISEFNQNTNLTNAGQEAVIMTTAILQPLDGKPVPDTGRRVYVRGGGAMAVEPKFVPVFEPGTFSTPNLEERPPVEINPAVMGGKRTKYLRELGEDMTEPPAFDVKMTEIKGRGFSTGSVLSLHAIGPQDEFMSNRDYGKSQWNPEFKQHTNFVMYQRVIPFPPASPTYHNQTIQLELLPQTHRHLLTNKYFK